MADMVKGEQVSVILPKPVKRRARALARSEGITLAAWIRRLAMSAVRDAKKSAS